MERLEFKGSKGLILAADAYGDPLTPPVLMFPGGGQTRRSWQRTAEALAARHCRPIAVDLRGHGESAWAGDGDYSIDAMADDVACVVRALDTPPVVIGASIGGVAATIALGEDRLLAVEALVLVDIVPRIRDDGVEKIRDFMRSGLDGFDSPEEAARKVTEYLPHRPPRTVESLAANLRQAADGRWYWHWDPAFQANAQERRESGLFGRMDSAAKSIRIPVLLVTGGRSEVVDEAAARAFVASLHDGRWSTVADAAHMVAGDANTPFAAAILQFLEGLPAHRADAGARH
jgi:pimeloyl-ACP methyl ester carboxylesterase